MSGELDHIIRVMSGTHGKDISRYDESFLTKSLEKRMAATAIATITGYRDYLLEHADEAEELSRSLNITYSEFFRDPLTFALLEQLVLPKLIAEKQETGTGTAEIRVWSAGCAAGQESYSVAILLDELLTAHKKSLSFRIFATDISEKCLATASRGVYDLAAVQNVRQKHLTTGFNSHNGTYSVVRRLKDRIEFSVYDLFEEHSASPPGSIYGDFDLVLCSNLLFYYRPEIQQFIVNKLCHSMSSGGYLVTGEAERAIVERSHIFQPVSRLAAVYRKKLNKGDL
ncbi:MAG: protein-glutamate O-methyltransferase CheR [Methanoregula sp.]|nr:protein-glutamate O-methyltransferase CheR [Methanoregula sp.]